MARRHQKSGHAGGSKSGPGSHQSEIDRLIESGRAKDAFKQAKLYFRQEPTPENRLIVERTYLSRVEELISGGMVESAREVAANMLEFGVTNPDILQKVVLLLPQVGLADKAITLQGAVTSPEAQASLAAKIADRAVLHPEETPASMPELRAEAGKVRAALAALESGNEAQAMELLQSIPRGSHLADWRLFVRGLAAFRRSETEQTRANWERLDPQRASHKIAHKLLPANRQEKSNILHKQFGTLETKMFGEPILERLSQLREALAKTDWNRVRRLVAPLQLSLRRVDPRWSQRLTELVLAPLAVSLMASSSTVAEQRISEFIALLEPLPWDPRWNRFQALLWEGEQGNTEDAIAYWQEYVKDLENGPPVSGVEPKRIQALVLRRIAGMLEDMADDDDVENDDDWYEDEADYDDEDAYEGEFPDSDLEDADESPLTQVLRNEAVEALEKSLELDPTQRKTHEKLIEFHESHDSADLAAVALRNMLAVFPDDVDAMRRLIAHHVQRDEPEPVLRYIQRIRALKPLDSKVLSEEIWGRLSNARHLALEGRFQEGREEFARVKDVPPERLPPHHFLARQAAFEFKAGVPAVAENFVRQAQETLDEPTPAWLSLAIEAARYRLPKALQQRFNKQFKEAVGRKVSSKTAGVLASMMIAYLGRDYTGRAGHLREVLRYLGRTTRTKYDEQDLRSVCAFLHEMDDAHRLEDKLVNRGVKSFPNSPYFLYQSAVIEISKGPFAGDANLVHSRLEKALALAQASEDPTDAQLIPGIKSALSRMEDIREAMSAFPFGPANRQGMPPMPPMIEEMLGTFFDQFQPGGPDLDDDDLPPSGRSRKRGK